MHIYTDGGCSGNPGPGSWAFVIIDDDDTVVRQKYGGERCTTNNRMELSAVIEALTECTTLMPGGAAESKSAASITLFTDSQYVQTGQTQWILNWKKNGWRTADKKPVKNADLWQKLDTLAAQHSITWRWVRGHAGNRYNELCDALTQQGIREQQQ
jgi:ribonuclease HI